MDQLCERSEISQELFNRIPQKFHDDLRRFLDNPPVIADDAEIHSWLKWVENHKYLKKVSTAIPSGILPSGYTGVLHDVKVFSKNQPDDVIYDVHEDIRRKVARGNCILELYDPSGCKSYRVLARGLRKFTGDVYDDDDCEEGDGNRWQIYFLRPVESARVGISVQKLDGEAGHFSAFWIAGRFILVGGSKNVHIVFRQKPDIGRYVNTVNGGNANRFRTSQNISEVIWSSVESLNHRDRNILLSFLHYYHVTINVEHINSQDQRVEDLSFVGKDLRFIAWTRNELGKVHANEDQTYCVLSPDVGMEVAKALTRLKTCNYSYFDPAEFRQVFMEVQKEFHREGAVLYFVDDNRAVIGLIKRKTLWYVLSRVIFLHARQALLSKSRPSELVVEKLVKIGERFDKIQKVLDFTDNCKRGWLSLAEGFLNWGRIALMRNAISTDDLRYRFPVLWKKFLMEEGRSDEISPRL